MRTKTLLLAAVLSAAGIASSLAQVYSVNVVGYVNVPLTAGFNLICNPLKNTSGNELSKILPLTAGADDGTAVYAFSGGAFQASTFFAGSWIPDLAINPGTGIFINVAAAKTVTFVGEVTQDADSNIPLSAGLSLISSPVPQSLSLSAMGYPAVDGDIVYFFRGAAGAKTYEAKTFFGGTWIPDAVPGVGEGFWASRASAGTWTRNFKVQ